MPVSRPDLMRWQFDFTWSLAEVHLRKLRPEDFLWEPAAHCWTLRQGAGGAWVPDFAEVEPDPVPVPTIAWLSWHLGWWWSVTLDHASGRPPRERDDVRWPGAEHAVDWLRGLRTGWIGVLDGLSEPDLDAVATFPWPDNTELTVAHQLGWVNAELMKNVAEIGQLRMLRAAG
ncbi:DinB family protein [Prauserella cavernicola]|uniref:DinB family protein n=1 Tax=Prauserella cavernicola TaxID=2800127 RepID=A0A934QVK3_9PSEU|nr:DinB family protein [Prauserella cavernicola]MBK1786128.1 DinB family protein [Prauserella cavernicola]